MSTAVISRDTTSPISVRRLAPGLIAGTSFAMWAMIVGLFYSRLWAPPQGIAQSIGIGSQGYDFQLIPFVLGAMGHMMNSIIIGIIFLVVVSGLKLQRGALLAAGMAYGALVYAVMYWPILRGVLSSTSGSFLNSNPEWSWVLAHLMYGVGLAALLAYGPLRGNWVKETK